ncbi:MAG: GMP synthase, partial [Halobacteriaceae archaeon]
MRVAIIDNGGQFTHLERRALQDLGVEAEILDNNTPANKIDHDGIVLSGGPDIDAVGNCDMYLELDLPILGICLGMQVMAHVLDGTVESGEYGGYADVTVRIVDESDPIVGPLAPTTQVWASHGDEVTTMPTGFRQT